ncbi:MAG: zinc-dependent peptidase [Bacteroidia bacterium]|nr:zinc-dependent peptidase [Bacteroidia bacterium]MDW8157284.1 zinc-dependent peptidase [Bacteroidia bacterium]
MKIRFLARKARLHFFLAKCIALSFAIIGGGGIYYFILLVQDKFYSPWLYGLYVLVPIFSYGLYTKVNARYIRRIFIYRTPFPEKWRNILKETVVYYQGLSPTARKKFEKRIQIFLAEKHIEGIQTSIDDKIKLWVACSAVIPAMGFEDADYDDLGTIFIYPQDFSSDFQLNTPEQAYISGLVAGPYHYNAMILSKPALVDSFSSRHPGRHVGIHEFIHVLDREDGAMDGIPAIYLNEEQIQKWIELMQQEMRAIINRHSNIDSYAATSSVEFLAVVGEYFFTYPEMLKAEHPQLYDLFKIAFRQDPQQILKNAPQAQIYKQHLFRTQHPEHYTLHFWDPFFVRYHLVQEPKTT